ncbi:MAG: hypothetical protein PVSMB8_05610 [Vulcanimicrobiaceae bacterium]
MMTSAFVTLLLVSVAGPSPRVKGPPSTQALRGTRERRVLRPPTTVPSDAYAARTRRRYARYLRLRLLELREAGLERAAAVVERRLPVDVLVPAVRDGERRL